MEQRSEQLRVISRREDGASLLELLITITILMVLLAMVSALLSGAMTVRAQESERADAQASARAAINLMSREIGNSGYGLTSNGIVVGDSGGGRVHFRANLDNSDALTNGVGEDIVYFYDAASESIARYDSKASPQRSILVNRVSEVTFQYFDYSFDGSVSGPNTAPSANTGLVRIRVRVRMRPTAGQPGRTIDFASDIALRNSDYLLRKQ
jgi:Tfp pilus assembly protein PilW